MVGASLSLSGDFAADGQAFERGYKLWANDVNAKGGGLLGHRSSSQILSDASKPGPGGHQLPEADRLRPRRSSCSGPFSTLLTVPASKIVNRYGYAFVEGAGGAPCGRSATASTTSSTSACRSGDNLVAVRQYMASLPPAQRPKTAAYATVNDPFTQPQIPLARRDHGGRGDQDRLHKVFPAEVTDYHADRQRGRVGHAEAVVLGSVDVPTVSAFVHTFIQQHFNPKAFIATAGPDQGATFVKAVGGRQRERDLRAQRLVSAAYPKADSQQMVRSTSPSTAGHAVRRQRRRGRGLLGRPGARPGGRGDAQPGQREDHQPTSTAA